MQLLRVKESEQGQRIDKYIRKYLNNAPLSYIYKLFRKKQIKVNGKKVAINYLLNVNDEISIYINDSIINEFNLPKTISRTCNKLEIIYEDENILVINKDEGIIVHQGEDNKLTNTLNNDILNYLKNKGEYGESDLFVPSCVHRLDRNTSGLIIASKNLQSSKELLELFSTKEKLKKYYLTIVKGKIDEPGIINKPLLKDSKNKIVTIDKNGLSAITKYKPLFYNEQYTLLEVEILTGRTHQIRVHLASINHPVIGDDKYGDFKLNKEFHNKFNYKHQFLHSYKIIFKNLSGKLSYLSNKEFIAPLKKEEKRIISLFFPDSNF